jgi:hypothetical protein
MQGQAALSMKSRSSQYCLANFISPVIFLIAVVMMFKSIRRSNTQDTDSLRKQAIYQELKSAFIDQINHYLATKHKVCTFFDLGEDSSCGFLYNDVIVSVDLSSEDCASFMVYAVVYEYHVGDHHDHVISVNGIVEEVESTTTTRWGNGIRIERGEDSEIVVFQHNPIWTLQPEALDSFEEKIDTFVGAAESMRDMINQASSTRLKSRRSRRRRNPTTAFIRRIFSTGKAA